MYTGIEHIFVLLGGDDVYVYSHLEDYINQLYKFLSIDQPEQLNIPTVAAKLGLEVRYGNVNFCIGKHIMLQKSTKQKEWQMFGHEVCHYLRHYGNQLKMHPLFVDLQEYQANYFSYHFCVPTFMLSDLREVTHYVIMEKFNVEENFALRRLEMYQNKLWWRESLNAL